MDGLNYWVTPAITDTHTSEINDIVARIEDVTKIPITTKGRYRSLCEGRQLAAYIMHVKYGMSLMSVGERLLIDHATVSHATKCVKALLQYDKKFVARWKEIITFAKLDKETDITEPETIQDESELPTKCEECSAYLIGKHFCELRMIKCHDNKPIAAECRKYHLKKRV